MASTPFEIHVAHMVAPDAKKALKAPFFVAIDKGKTPYIAERAFNQSSLFLKI
jgi:hypothetical protein